MLQFYGQLVQRNKKKTVTNFYHSIQLYYCANCFDEEKKAAVFKKQFLLLSIHIQIKSAHKYCIEIKLKHKWVQQLRAHCRVSVIFCLHDQATVIAYAHSVQ